jgi:hypothetical protein
MAKKERSKPKVKLPLSVDDKPVWTRVGVFAAVGLVIGVAWPSLAGIRIGPEVPGAKKGDVSVAASASIQSSAVALSSKTAAAKPTAAASAPSSNEEQLVVVSGGVIKRCYKKKKKLDADECGKLAVDGVLASRLKKLHECPSVLGLAGEMELRFDINFGKKEIRVNKAGKSKIPNSTVNGIIACAADFIRDVTPEKIPHKYTRYLVAYGLKFYPPGTAPSREGASKDKAGGDDAKSRGLATVTWDTALVRSEPRTGKVVARIVRGTRVKLLGRRKDWFRVKVGSREGWVYRGALAQ